MNERNYRTTTDKFVVDDLYIPKSQKETDPLNAAKGLINGLILGGIFYLVVYAVYVSW